MKADHPFSYLAPRGGGGGVPTSCILLESSLISKGLHLQANTIASVQRHVIDLPKWLKMPNKLTRQWVMYSFMGLGAGYVGVFLIRSAP